MAGPSRKEFDNLSDRTDNIEKEVEEVDSEIQRININVQNIKETNIGDHKSIIDGQGVIHKRMDTFLQGQNTNYVNTLNSLCNHMDKRQDAIYTKHGKDVSTMKNVMFGQDENGGLVAKAEGLKRSTIALWTVVGFIIMILCALMGLIIYLD